MSEDAPGNPGAVSWPDGFTASVMVRSMQVKLHRWAAGDPGRRFGDLFNLVYDPAFLAAAWDRVAANKGGRGPRASTGPPRPGSRPRSGSWRSWARSGTR
jgi:RNA-directed DNA polymerase